MVLLCTACRETTGGVPDHTPYADTIADQADNLLNGPHPENSITYLDSAYHRLAHIGILDAWRNYNHKVNYYLRYRKSTDTATLYADSMLALLKDKEKRYAMQYSYTLFLKGNISLARKDYEEAFQSYFEGKRFAQQNLDSCDYSTFSGKLALVRYKQTKYMEAIPYLRQALEESTHCKEGTDFNTQFTFPQGNMNTIALCYEKSNMPDSAIYFYKQALAFVARNESKFPERHKFMQVAIGVIDGNLGGVYASLNNYGEAEKYLQESIRINNHPGFAIEDAQTAQLKLARVYLEQAHYDKVNEILEQVNRDLVARRGKSLINEDIWLRWYKLKWDYFYQIHDIEQAYNYSQLYHTMHDEMEEVNMGLKTADIDAGLKNAEEQYHFNLLRKDNQLKTNYLSTAIGFLVMSVAMLFTVVYYLKRSRKNVDELTRLNQEIREHNIQIQNALTALEQSQEENTRMMKIVAHDLRNPVNSIAIITETILKGQHHSKEDQMMLSIIKTSGEHSLRLINDLLLINTQTITLKKDPIDLYILLRYCVDMLRFKAEEKRQQIELEAPHFVLTVNQEKMWRVFNNLVANAIKFSPSGATIGVKMTIEDEVILIAVKDHGIGIPADMRETIFDMFTDIRRPGTSGEQPFGMGLAISKQIVEVHGGKIWFESVPGSGTIFYIELPIA
ncbi:hypothetical protein F5148DRAFT_1292579 [Russula earlei]|uniref:Uncharacterized protein n=1 Tax=Russula earlei TaxID=71964 RepID=A0ACC0TVE0_9AGAM|nr:hypothetical protein F5148DRAFT_1292579 [Russula earlei]